MDGAVLTWIDIDALKRSLEQAREARDYAEAIVETVREALLILDGSLRIKTANRSFYRTFRTSPEDSEGRSIFDLGDRQWDRPELRKLLDGLQSKDAAFQDLEIEGEFPVVGRKVMRLNARRILQGPAAPPLILLAIDDITAQKQEAQRREHAEDQLRQLQKLEAIGTLAGGIAHDLNNVFAPIILNAEMGLMDVPPESPLREALALILKSGHRGKGLVNSSSNSAGTGRSMRRSHPPHRRYVQAAAVVHSFDDRNVRPSGNRHGCGPGRSLPASAGGPEPLHQRGLRSEGPEGIDRHLPAKRPLGGRRSPRYGHAARGLSGPFGVGHRDRHDRGG
jgi:two-component system CheB/CheR fusion protein